ncbi:MAG: alkaline phosphatase family protein [Phycisphaerae bacterium]|jgi:predicted AlkP superfamily phosphohydrolase/phosphomutase
MGAGNRRNGQRVFVLGIDGASWNVLDVQLAAGRMPALAAFLAGGVRGDLASVVPPITPAAWSSFHTGKHPDKHGVLDFRGFDSRRGRLYFNSARQIRGATLWQQLSEHGRRVGLVHVPMTYPPPAVNGVVVSGFDTPSLDSAFCHPPELRGRLLEWFPDYLFAPDRAVEDSAAHMAALLAAGRKGLGQRADLVERLHAGDRFDVFMVNFQELDWLLHKIYLYAVEEDEHLRQSGLMADVRAFFETLDGCLDRVLRIGRDYDVQMMVSDHGFTRDLGILYPNAVLEARGFLARRPEGEPEPHDWPRRLLRAMERSNFRPVRALAGAVHGWRRPPLGQWVVEQQREVSASDVEFDLKHTLAAVVASDMYGLLYLNRHPQGPLAGASEEKLAGLRRTIAELFRNQRNPLDDGCVYRQVLEPPGGAAGEPGGVDLILVPRDGYRVQDGVSSLSRFTPMVFLVGKADTAGTHRVDGLLAAAGPTIEPRAALAGCRLVDVAPTLLALAGVPIPDDMDGSPIAAITGNRPLVLSRAACPATAAARADEADAYTERERELIRDRLQALGYLE